RSAKLPKKKITSVMTASNPAPSNNCVIALARKYAWAMIATDSPNKTRISQLYKETAPAYIGRPFFLFVSINIPTHHRVYFVCGKYNNSKFDKPVQTVIKLMRKAT